MIEIILFFLLLCISLYLVMRSAESANSSSIEIARSLRLPKYVIGFLIVAVISILPETFISITSAIDGIPSFGLGTLFGSNVADLTLIFALVVLISGKKLKVASCVIKNSFLYIGIMLLPLLFGINGFYSRMEGIILVVAGCFFYWFILKNGHLVPTEKKVKFSFKNIIFLAVSMGCLLAGAKYTVDFGVSLAVALNISPVVIGMFIVGLGTTMPELFFSLRAAKEKNDSLALGDILGTVVADATVVVGIISIIHPFSFDPKIVYMTGSFMFGAILILLHFMKTGKVLSKKESVLLLLFYVLFVLSEAIVAGL